MYNVQHKSYDNYPRFYFQVNDWSRWDSATYHTWAGNNSTSTELMRLGATGGLTITGTTAANVGLIIKGAASQTANLTEWQNNSGTVRAAVDANGFIVAGAGSAISNAIISARPFGGSQVGVAVRGYASQTANLQEWQNSAGTVLAKVNSSGNIVAGDMAIATSSVSTIHISNGTIPSADPTGGGVLYVEAGALKFRGSSGTVTTIAVA